MSRIYSPEFLEAKPGTVCHDELDCMLAELASEQMHDFDLLKADTGIDSEANL